jgi:hypothetical protein
MPFRTKRSFLEHLTTLVLLGILAGTVAGLGIGYMLKGKSTSTVETTKPSK